MADKSTSAGDIHGPFGTIYRSGGLICQVSGNVPLQVVVCPNCSHVVFILNRCKNCGARKEGDEWADGAAEDEDELDDAEDEDVDSDDDNDKQEVAIVTDTEVTERTWYQNKKCNKNCDACKKGN